jgi:negative regulator of sigma-B (phosphoserine phosphatase)
MVAVIDSAKVLSPSIVWGVAGLALENGESGDLSLVLPRTAGALFAVIDGLGHGPAAEQAAKEAANVLAAHPDAPLIELVERCHEGLRHTRGAVMSIAALDERAQVLEWVGVGNVEGVVRHANAASGRSKSALILSGGVIGYRLPPIRVRTVPLLPGDLIVLATDGVDVDFTNDVDLGLGPQALAESLLMRFGKPTDDALVLVVRYREELGHEGHAVTIV